MEGYAATVVHQIDVGGIAPGSTAVYARENFQEGLRIPILKLYAEGMPNRTFFEIMALNTRMPDKLAGDMQAQMPPAGRRRSLFRSWSSAMAAPRFVRS